MPAPRVSDAEVAMLQDVLTGADDRAAERAARLSEADAAGGIPWLLYAALIIAARRKFGPAWTRADIVRFTARVRAMLAGHPDARQHPDLLDPLAAEHELRSALGEDVPGSPAPMAKAAAQVMLLAALVLDAGMDSSAVSSFLEEARGLADRMTVVPPA
jgi:hypothetical protein